MVYEPRRASAGANMITGTGGDDDILVTIPTAVDGLGGFDIVRFNFLNSPVGVYLNLSEVWTGGVGRLNGFEIRNVEALGSALGGGLGDAAPFVIGSQHDDVIILGANYLARTVLIGDAGDDTLVGGDGDSASTGANNFLDGGSGNDLVIGGARSDDLLGEDGNDRLFGLGGDDLLFGDGGKDLLRGGDGNDYLRGGTDNDHLFGDAGDDRLDGAFGNDILDGGAGSDTAEYYFADGGVTVDLRAGRAWENLGGFTDQLISIENAGGTFYSDVLIGSDAANRLSGDAGDDRLIGGGGDDVLWGGAGADVLEGGAGADLFLFQETDPGRDLITDFNAAAGDRIDLSSIDAVWSTPFDDAFQFIGDAAFSGTAGELQIAAQDGGWLVSGDCDGDAVADFSILVLAQAPPLPADFIL